MNKMKLDARRILETVEALRLRIYDRFPKSGLMEVGNHLAEVGRQTEITINNIGSPIWPMRVVALAVVALVIGLVGWLVTAIPHVEDITFEDGIQIAEAATNMLIFSAIAIFWLWTSEVKMRRAKVLRAMNRLREIAHVIDMHQLTKDPDAAFHRGSPTKHSPKRTLTPYQLDRYLDYCSELLSLISKLGYLYVSKFDDQEASQSAAELEALCSGLSRKIWQKIMVLQNLSNREPEKMDPNFKPSTSVVPNSK